MQPWHEESLMETKSFHATKFFHAQPKGSSSIVKRDPKHIERALRALDYHIVEHKLQQSGYLNPQIKSMKKECMRFLALCMTQPRPCSPSFLVDEFWHQCILHTALYAQITSIAGRFIHHHPSDGSAESAAQNRQSFWNTIDAYEAIWGTPNLSIWGIKRR